MDNQATTTQTSTLYARNITASTLDHITKYATFNGYKNRSEYVDYLLKEGIKASKSKAKTKVKAKVKTKAAKKTTKKKVKTTYKK